MACKSCGAQARALVRATTQASRAASTTPASTTSARRLLTTRAGAEPRSKALSTQTQARNFSGSGSRLMLQGFGAAAPTSTYMVVGATERLYKVCGGAANYVIKEETRKQDRVQKLDDGEEVGESRATRSVWHQTFNLPPTFSTWSHVTMLHLYLLNARVRCFERDVYRQWQQQLIDHFFFDAEKKMHVDHALTSSALRQRYLKDIFVQWRGLLVAYDEGLVKGDAVLASAVWRNLFKGDPNVDPRALAAVVGWMRAGLKALEATSDFTFATRAAEILEMPVEKFWKQMTQIKEEATEEAVVRVPSAASASAAQTRAKTGTAAKST